MPGNRVSNGLGAMLLLAAGLAATPALAQSASDYRLPGATSTPDPRAAGPIDPSDPTVSAPRARTATTPVPPPSPTTAAPTPSAAVLPSPSVNQPPRQTTPRTATARGSGPASLPAAPLPAPAPQSSPALPESAASESPASPLPAIQPAPQASVVPATAVDWRPWAAGAAAALLALLGALWWRRRTAREPEVEFEPPVVAAPEPGPAPLSAPVAAPEPAPLPAPVFAPPSADLALDLDARRLTASLMATTLNYALRLTNTGTAPMAALAIEADLVSAHSSLPVDQQIASDGQRLELRHAQVELAPGESVEFTGDLRLPLTEITPIRSGNAAYFVPLARFRVESAERVAVQTFVIGELPEQAGAALRPFRLDLGPRTYSSIGQRPVA